jgi:hypothetical protein
MVFGCRLHSMRFAGSKSDTSVILPSCEQQRKISAFTNRNVYKLRHVITSNQHPTHFIWVQNLIISKNHDADMILHRPELEQDIHAAPTSLFFTAPVHMVLNCQLILEVAVLKSELCFYPLTPALLKIITCNVEIKVNIGAHLIFISCDLGLLMTLKPSVVLFVVSP